jgi:hypothetical protein
VKSAKRAKRTKDTKRGAAAAAASSNPIDDTNLATTLQRALHLALTSSGSSAFRRPEPPVERAPSGLLERGDDDDKLNRLINHFQPLDARRGQDAVNSISEFLQVSHVGPRKEEGGVISINYVNAPTVTGYKPRKSGQLHRTSVPTHSFSSPYHHIARSKTWVVLRR